MNKIENLVFEYFSKIITDALDRVRAQDTGPNHIHIDYDKRNAFQHSYVSGYIANLLGEDIALLFGYQKEIITEYDELIANQYDLQKTYLDTNRDLWNNKVGIEYAKKSTSNEELAKKIYNNIWNEESDFITSLENDDRKWKENAHKNNLWDLIRKEFSSVSANIFYNSRDTDMPEDMINDLYDQYNGYRGKFHSAGDCECTPKDPIIFDLNNDGVLETTDINNGIYFDHENDGFAESSAWVGDNDGILVIDSNNNGDIDNASELLTAETLASFDTNEDGIIDENDTNFANLKILKGDGTLLPLAEAGITSINLNTTSTEITDENGNQQFASGTFTRADGTTGTFGEFLVKTETSNSIATELLEETDGIAELPDISGSGNIYSLHRAMLRDESGELVA